jgi:hypothetical protein
MHDGFITFNMEPVETPWGGGNQWLYQFIEYAKSKGFKVNFQLNAKTKCIFVVNYKSINVKKNFFFKYKNKITFNLKELENFKKKFPNIPVIVRVNDTDLPRKTDFIDTNFLRINKISSHNIYISRWVRNYFLRKINIKNKTKHTTILMEANKKFFFIKKKFRTVKSKTIRIVTHHWSNNAYQKGYDRYLFLDNLLFKKKIKNIKFLIIGNVPKNISFKTAKIYPPLFQFDLAKKIRSSDIYFTGARFEAGGNHVIEGISCGLPVIYYSNSGGIVEYSKNFGIETNNRNILRSIMKIKNNYSSFILKIKKKYKNSNANMNDQYLKIIDNYLIKNSNNVRIN